ncbi:MAG: hypothetical protein KDD43_00180 [Bdellovibrionales bacterium]|nr:hypothetical protein [Bdellovibrionales bacterium]
MSLSRFIMQAPVLFGDKYEFVENIEGESGVCFTNYGIEFAFYDTEEDREIFQFLLANVDKFEQVDVGDVLGDTVRLGGRVSAAVAKLAGKAVLAGTKGVGKAAAFLIHQLEKGQDAMAEKVAGRVGSLQAFEKVERAGIKAKTEWLVKQGMLWGVFPGAILGTITALGAPVVVALLVKAVLWTPWINKFFNLVKAKLARKEKSNMANGQMDFYSEYPRLDGVIKQMGEQAEGGKVVVVAYARKGNFVGVDLKTSNGGSRKFNFSMMGVARAARITEEDLKRLLPEGKVIRP